MIVARAYAIYCVPALLTWAARTTLPALWDAHPWIDQALFKGLMAAATVAALRCDGVSLRDSGFRLPLQRVKWPRLILGIVALNLAWVWASLWLRLPGDSRWELLTLCERIFWGGFYASAIEEACYRGWFQTALVRSLGGRCAQRRADPAVVLSATVFASVHLFLIPRGVAVRSAIGGVAVSLVVGWIAALLRRRTESVLPGMAAHVAFNVSNFLVSYGIWFLYTHPRI
jgi:membrane protease YdiL (CAAX protease family)